MRNRFVTAVLAFVGFFGTVVLPPMPADAGISSNTAPITLTGASAPVVVYPLTSQSTMTVETVSNTGLTLSYKVLVAGSYVPVAGSSYDQTVSNVTSSTAAGTLTFPVGGTQAFEIVPSGSGTAVINYRADSTTTKVIGAGVNGGKTTLVGSGPVTVTNSGSTATVGLTDPLPILYGGTGATALPTGCLQSNGTAVFSIGTACGTGSGSVTAVTGSGNINVTSGATPNVTITSAPTFGNVTDTGLTANNCVYTGTNGLLLTGASGVTPTFISSVTSGTFPAYSNSTGSFGIGYSQNLGSVSTSNTTAYPAYSIVDGIDTSTGANLYFVDTSPIPASGGGGAQLNLVFSGLTGTNSSHTVNLYYEGNFLGPLISTGSSSDTYTGGATYTLPTANTIDIPNNTLISLYNTANSYGYFKVTTSDTPIGATTINFSDPHNGPIPINSPPSSFASVQVNIVPNNLNPPAGGVNPSCVTSITAGTSNVTVAQSTPGAYTISVATSAPAPTASPVSVQAGTGIAVATPSPGVYVVSNTGTITVTGSGNIQSSGGTTPNVTITNAPTFQGLVTANGGVTTSTVNAVDVYDASLSNPVCVGTNGTGGAGHLVGNLNCVASVTGAAPIVSSGGANPTISCTTCVTGVTAGSNIVVGAGTTPSVGVTVSPTFSGIVTGGNFIDTGLTSGRCVQTTTAGLLAVATAACATGTRAELTMALGFIAGTLTTSNVYPYFQVGNFTGGTITALRVACATADNGTTVFTVTDVTTSTTIGTISMANAATTATTTLGSPYSLTAGHVLTTSVTTAGTATSCGVTTDGIQNTF